MTLCEAHGLTLHTSPLGQKLLGSSALGSQSQPRGRHLHWTQLSSAEQVESSAEASGSPEQGVKLRDVVTIYTYNHIPGETWGRSLRR